MTQAELTVKVVKTEAHEMVRVELTSRERLCLYTRLYSKLHYPNDLVGKLKELGIGFELPENWPFDDTEITLAQLVVIAQKLQLDVVINELDLIERK